MRTVILPRGARSRVLIVVTILPSDREQQVPAIVVVRLLAYLTPSCRLLGIVVRISDVFLGCPKVGMAKPVLDLVDLGTVSQCVGGYILVG